VTLSPVAGGRWPESRCLPPTLVGKPKQFRHVANDKLDPRYLAFVQLASVMV
jgi:hypothetical protein